jgi:DNA-binding phage protein
MKVTSEEKAIIRLKSDRQGINELAEEYGVSKAYIYKILGEESSLTLSILLKMIPIFVDKELKVDLTPEEIAFVSRIYQEGSY